MISAEAAPSTVSASFCNCCVISVALFLIDSNFFWSPSYQRQAKYTENRLKAIKARNEYLLALEATNSCVFKYYIHDLSDIIDVSLNTHFEDVMVEQILNLRLCFVFVCFCVAVL